MENGIAVRLKYVTSVVLYGTIGLFVRYAGLPSELLAMCRGIIGAAFILLVLRVRRDRPDLRAIRANLPALIVSGVCLGLNWVFLFAAYVKTTVAVASLCNYMAPIIVVVIAPVALRERLDLRKLPCVAAALLGILLVSGVLEGGVGDLTGALLGLCAAACFVCLVLCNRKLRGIRALDRAVVQLALSSVTIFPYALIANRGVSLSPDVPSLLVVLLLGVVHTGVAYCFYFSGMATLPVQTFAVLGYLEPVVSVLCSVLFLHEPLSAAGWIGAALVITAAAVSELMPERERAP
ncbi:MAG: EamA family transporter [Oscillospiraceae bacterium]|nr:EamA family transporter [Oscillospiraceae bacterium]